MKKIISALCFTFSLTVDAHAITTERFAVQYQEAGQYTVDVFEQEGQNFQNLVQRHKFSTQAAADSFVAEMKLNSAPKLNANNYQLPISELTEDEVLWVATDDWNQDWETAYTQWIEESIDTDFFKRFNVATDCADVTIALRWIFSHTHKLPMANSLAGSGRLFTNESMLRAWANLPTADLWFNDRRFRAALDYVLNNTYTHSLIVDSYPIAIRPGVFTAGAYHLSLSRQSGHTRVVTNIDQEAGGIYLIASTVPREIRSIWLEYYDDSGNASSPRDGGFFKTRWAQKSAGQWQLVAQQSMPGYSLEQYDSQFKGNHRYYYTAVEDRLGVLTTPEVKMRLLSEKVFSKLEMRRQIVLDGYSFCQTNSCLPGSANYDAWSTPQRDKSLYDLILIANELSWEENALRAYWKEFIRTRMLEIQGQNYSLETLLDSFYEESLSSDPRDPILQRWGL